MSESIRLTPAERDRVRVIQQVVEGKLTAPQAARLGHRSVSQVWRLCHRLKTSGPTASGSKEKARS